MRFFERLNMKKMALYVKTPAIYCFECGVHGTGLTVAYMLCPKGRRLVFFP